MRWLGRPATSTVVIVAGLALAGQARAATAHNAYVTNFGANTVTPVDTVTNQVGTAITVGPSPIADAITPDGKMAYVVTQTFGKVYPIDTATNTAGAAISVGAVPTGIAITPDGRTVYVANLSSNSVTPIDVATNTPGTPIAVGTNPVDVAIAPDGKTAYVTNFGSGTVTPIDTATNTTGTAISVGSRPEGIAITPDGKTAYVTDQGGNQVVPIDLATSTAGTPIAVPNGPFHIAITPDGRTAYVVSVSGATGVTPIDIATNTAGANIAASGLGGIAVTPDGSIAYVADQGASTVIPIATATNTPGTAIGVGTNPFGIAVTPDQPPVAAFTAPAVKVGNATSFDASASSDSDRTITSYHWDFGDGTTSTTASQTISHTYAAAGQYTATVTATDNAGCSTQLVFTGRTASCNGSSTAQASHQVTVSQTAAPTTTVTLAPAAPTGSNGWYTGPVSVSVAASDPDDAVAQTRCALDPASVPASFDALPASACSLTAVSADGLHTIYVASKDVQGSVEAVHSVSVKIDQTPPTVSVTTPTAGATYTVGQAVRTSFACSESAAGPGVTSCIDGAGKTSGVSLDTSTAGAHTFTVTATSLSGQSSSSSFGYEVAAPPQRPTNAFRVAHVRVRANGRCQFELTVPGAGHIDTLETAWRSNEARAATVLLQPASGRFVFPRAHLDATGAATIHVTVKPNARGRRLIGHHRGGTLRIRLWVTYRPTAGAPRSIGIYGIPIPTR